MRRIMRDVKWGNAHKANITQHIGERTNVPVRLGLKYRT
jgi:hypothetical protein